MIPYITYTDLIIKIREAIITQSELNGNSVINAVSVRGPALSKLISDNESTSLNLNDGFIIFELLENKDSENNIILQNPNDSSDNVSEYKLLLKIYGNHCHELSQKLVSRFKMESVIMDLYEKGIWAKNISFPETINEFLNNTVWPRCDLEITIIVRYNIKAISNIPFIEKTGELIIITGDKNEKENN